MADPRGFLKNRERELPPRRPVPIRLMDWREVYEAREQGDLGRVERQASRCMDCGIPFCHHGCPLGNLIPEWNELVYRGDWRDASERLHATNNFPEFTGRICPAPCEPACVLGINQPPVTIKDIELSIVERAFDEGWIAAQEPTRLSGRTVAVVGSGPAGLAVAQQLTRTGHTVVVHERSDRVGGLLRYGIPEFKLEKRHVERRLEQMVAEGTQFRTGVHVGGTGEGAVQLDELRSRFDAVVLAVGAEVPRELPVAGRRLRGVHFAMEYLTEANRVVEGDEIDDQIDARDKDVVIIGGGDTGADCLGTALRQGARSVRTLAIGRQPPSDRDEAHPWPTMPVVLEEDAASEEGGVRRYLASTTEFLDDGTGRVAAISVARTRYTDDGRRLPEPGTEETLPADLVLLAMGFAHPDVTGLGVDVDPRGNIVRDDGWQTSLPGVFVAGDAGRGQSLIVWAIAEGRACARAVDAYLSGSSELPAPVTPSTAPLSL